MRFLGIGEYNDLAAMYHGLAARGHEVRVAVADPACHDVFGGMLERVDDWREQLDWLRAAGEGGVALFESAIAGQAQDELRRDGFQVIGGCALGDRLEADREFGQQVLRASGLHTARSHSFSDYADAILDDGADMMALLAMYRDHSPANARPDFVLMEHLQGVEVGVGAYFNGKAFLDTACIDFEHKRFFSGELGELTGEMGTIVSYRGAGRLFDAALAPLAGLLREGGYCGYINVNLIANEAGLWPLEFTSRFGYPGFAICEALHVEPWEDIFIRMLRRDSLRLHTRGGFAAGVVLTVPPFPYRQGYEELSKGEPICFRPQMSVADRAALHFAEVARAGGQLVTSGACGYIGVATGTGGSVRQARDEAYRVARQVVIPNLRYRTDIGDRVISRDLLTLMALGWLDADAAVQGGS